jgi:hypothetical protein
LRVVVFWKHATNFVFCLLLLVAGRLQHLVRHVDNNKVIVGPYQTHLGHWWQQGHRQRCVKTVHGHRRFVFELERRLGFSCVDNVFLLLSAICERLLTEWKDTHVLLGSRSQERGQQAVDDLISTIGGDCQERLQLLVLDTSSDDSVGQAANKLQESGNTNLYGIINNAGVRKFGARERRACAMFMVCLVANTLPFFCFCTDWARTHHDGNGQYQLLWSETGQ